MVTKHFGSIVLQLQCEGQLLYKERLLIFHQGCGLVICINANQLRMRVDTCGHEGQHFFACVSVL